MAGVCSGCLRTLDQIKTWSVLEMSERMRIMQEIRSNVSTHNCPTCSGVAYCAMMDGKSSNLCWCMTEVRTGNPDTSSDVCLCKKCLLGGVE